MWTLLQILFGRFYVSAYLDDRKKKRAAANNNNFSEKNHNLVKADDKKNE